MSANWANNLDMLAQQGIINYDAPSDIMGTKPRYVGNPGFVPPTLVMPESTQPLAQPKVDEFKKSNQGLVNNPGWKKWAFGAVALAATLALGVKCKSLLSKLFKKPPVVF